MKDDLGSVGKRGERDMKDTVKASATAKRVGNIGFHICRGQQKNAGLVVTLNGIDENANLSAIFVGHTAQ